MKPLTPLQRKALFMGIRPAAIEVGEDPEVYRKRILKEELGVEHLDEVSRNGGFDKLMSRIWADRGDYERAISYSKGSEVFHVKQSPRLSRLRPVQLTNPARFILCALMYLRYGFHSIRREISIVSRETIWLNFALIACSAALGLAFNCMPDARRCFAFLFGPHLLSQWESADFFGIYIDFSVFSC